MGVQTPICIICSTSLLAIVAFFARQENIGSSHRSYNKKKTTTSHVLS